MIESLDQQQNSATGVVMTALALQIAPARLSAARVGADGMLEDARDLSTPDSGVWEECRKLLSDLTSGDEVTGVGIACVGPIDMAAGVAAPPTVPDWLSGFELGEAVRELFPAASIRIALDGVCHALAEQLFGAARGVPDTVVVSVSSGISGGVMMGGFVAVGRTGNTGHIGHVLVPGFDEPCLCGGRGCLEAIASEPAIVEWARRQGWSGASVADLAVAAGAGDPVSTAALGRAGTALGRALASAAALLDIGLVVVGGEVAATGSAFWDPMGEAVAIHARSSFLTGLRVVPSPLERPVLAGAGILATPAPA
ncbi:ROK family protein [Nocardia sp. NPDC050793]|uniref:ROK family protein n=1 Tax=Nocardia sp. NPDC050793 TaxID=3155159 RepID=UPI00340C5DFD